MSSIDHRALLTLVEALSFSADRHRTQTRKDAENSPYINHPIEVLRTLIAVGKITDTNVLAAALLHDTVEDTDATHEELSAQFGDTIAGIVAEVTDDQSLRSDERKRLQVERTPYASPEAKLVKLGDKIANIRDIVTAPPRHWSTERRRNYVNWANEVIAGTRGTNEALEQEFEALRDSAIQHLTD
ncbi:MAG: HD domain-containing protein [Pseudomonadota bacterium]